MIDRAMEGGMSASARREFRLMVAIGLGAALIALISARPYAGGWNDGSRLATVESLVDHGTLAIDRSIFVAVPPLEPDRPSPYPRDDELLQRFGTKDKLFVDGHYYSDKSPFPALYLSTVYQLGRWLGMPAAAERPDCFCLAMTWASSGLAYVVAVLGLFLIARRVGLDCRWSVLIVAAFGLGTVALPYAQYVNNHILLLAVAMLIFRALLIGEMEGWKTRRLLMLCALTGIAYTIDLGAGPPLLCLASILIVWQTRNLKVLWVVAAAMPWIVLHHAINYQIGGTLAPANANPAFFQWSGSPFNEQNMTGGWKHSDPFKGAVYALAMLFGKKGFLGHNLILFLPLIGIAMLIRRRLPERPVVLMGLVWSLGTWLIYAATSNNSSGACCSVRWFVPLLAPGLVAICVLLRECPAMRRDGLILCCGGALMGAGMAIRGPWSGRLMPFYFPIYLGTLVFWFAARWVSWRRTSHISAKTIVISERINLNERPIHASTRPTSKSKAGVSE